MKESVILLKVHDESFCMMLCYGVAYTKVLWLVCKKKVFDTQGCFNKIQRIQEVSSSIRDYALLFLSKIMFTFQKSFPQSLIKGHLVFIFTHTCHSLQFLYNCKMCYWGAAVKFLYFYFKHV